jgi:DNA invertase Pin-like site-specific DNA recombinase
MVQTIVHLQRLTTYGVSFHSYTEPHLATDNELVRNILLALLSSVANVEAQKISDRYKSGDGPSQGQGCQNRPTAPQERPARDDRRACPQRRDPLRHRQSSWHRSAYGREIYGLICFKRLMIGA